MEESRYPYLRLEHFVFASEEEAQEELCRLTPHIEAITEGRSCCITVPFYGKWKLICVNKKNHEQKTFVEKKPQELILLEPDSEEVLMGKIKFFNEQKGYGFIVSDESQGDVFFHQNNVLGLSHFDAGEPIEYKLSKGERGMVAFDVKSAAYG
jgi:CspA family cold shock protein